VVDARAGGLSARFLHRAERGASFDLRSQLPHPEEHMIQPVTEGTAAGSAAHDSANVASAPGGSPVSASASASATQGAGGTPMAASAAGGRAAQDPSHAAVLALVGALSRAISREESIPVEVGRAYNALLAALPER
jgi:hypothetical protein